MKLIFARHGETQENVDRILQGWNPGNLTEKGRMQIRAVSERLKNENIEKIYASPLRRTKITAKEIAKKHPDAELIYSDDLKDFNRGIFNGRPIKEYWEASNKSGKGMFDFVAEGGESIRDTQKRTRKIIDFILEKEKGKTILIVTHGGTIAKALLYLLNEPEDKYDLYAHRNDEISILKIDDKTKKIEILANREKIQP